MREHERQAKQTKKGKTEEVKQNKATQHRRIKVKERQGTEASTDERRDHENRGRMN